MTTIFFEKDVGLYRAGISAVKPDAQWTSPHCTDGYAQCLGLAMPKVQGGPLGGIQAPKRSRP